MNRNGKVLIFAGTSEGREIAARFRDDSNARERLIFSVATDYGSEILEDEGSFNILQGRMDRLAILKFLSENPIVLVVDSTHPYADKASDNIKSACQEADVPYVRLFREELVIDALDVEEELKRRIYQVDSPEDAGRLINKLDGKVFLTTGSKDLSLYSSLVKDFSERLFCRILPSIESIELANKAGFPSKNIIAMQGPFSGEMNLATLRQYGCKFLVTKSTGKAGGFDDKTTCLKEGYSIIVIKRPMAESGKSLEDVIVVLEEVLNRGRE